LNPGNQAISINIAAKTRSSSIHHQLKKLKRPICIPIYVYKIQYPIDDVKSQDSREKIRNKMHLSIWIINSNDDYDGSYAKHSPSLGLSWGCGVRVEALRCATAICAFRAALGCIWQGTGKWMKLESWIKDGLLWVSWVSGEKRQK